MENHQVGRVRDRQDKRRGIGDESAYEEIRQRLRLSPAHGRQDRRRQHHCRRVVGHENRNHGSHAVHQGEEACAGTMGAAYRDRRKPVKDPMFLGQFGQQHHAHQETDIRPNPSPTARPASWQRNQPQSDEQEHSATDPVDLRDASGPDQHQQDADGHNQKQRRR